MKRSFIILSLLLALLSLLGSCKQEVAKATPFTFNKPGQSPIAPTIGTSITLITPASSPAYVSTPTVRVDGVVDGESIRIFRDAACSTLIGSMDAAGGSATITTSVLPVGAFSFYTRTVNSFATSACSQALLAYQYLGIAPTRATSIALQSPTSSPSTDSTPTVLFSGVVAGETIMIYIDAGCSQLYGSVVASSTTAVMTTDALAAGSVQFYTKTSNSAGSTACSGAMLSYTYSGLPPNTASSLTLSQPTSTPNYISTPIFRAAGVANGDTVRIYTDACSTMVGSQVVGNSTSVLVTSSALAVGTYNFYTDSINSTGTSTCSPIRATYNYLGPAPVVRVSWTANREKSVNQSGGGYRIYYASAAGVNTSTASFINVPYVSGGAAPVTKDLTNLSIGTTYFKVVAFSTTLSTQSAASDEFSITLP